MIRFCKECDNPLDAEDAHAMRINPCTCEVDQFGGYTVEGVTGETGLNESLKILTTDKIPEIDQEISNSWEFVPPIMIELEALLHMAETDPNISNEFDPITEEEEYLVNDYDEDIERPSIEFTEAKCECGADAAKTGFHSSWCPKYVKL